MTYASARNNQVDLYIGTLDDPAAMAPTYHVHAGEQLPWFEIADDLPRYARARPATSRCGMVRAVPIQRRRSLREKRAQQRVDLLGRLDLGQVADAVEDFELRLFGMALASTAACLSIGFTRSSLPESSAPARRLVARPFRGS